MVLLMQTIKLVLKLYFVTLTKKRHQNKVKGICSWSSLFEGCSYLTSDEVKDN